MEEKILKPVPGLKGFLCDTDNMVVYKCKNGVIRPLTPIGFYKKLSLYSEGKTCVTTLYRVVYCTEHELDIRKIPSNFCFSYDGKKVKVCERKDIVKLAAEEKRKQQELSLEQAQKEFSLIKKYIKGNHAPLLFRLNDIVKNVQYLLRNRYGLSEDLASEYAEMGRDKVLERIEEGNRIALGLQRMVYCSARVVMFHNRATHFEDYMHKYIIKK